MKLSRLRKLRIKAMRGELTTKADTALPIQSIEQERASYALGKVKDFVEGVTITDAKKKEWKSRANEMPAMIQKNGLGQTTAFYLAKGGVHKKMYDLLSEWLCNKQGMYPSTAGNDLITGITTGDMASYRMAQAEAQALLLWVKKFSRAYCVVEDEQAQAKTEDAPPQEQQEGQP